MDPKAYDRFAVVAFATPEIVEAVEEIRRQLPPAGRPILPAHVTIKGTFVDSLDLDEILKRTRDCCAAAQPFTLTTGPIRVWGEGSDAVVVLEVEQSPPLTRLHWELVEALKALCTTTYYGEDISEFAPHLTLVQQIPLAEAEAAAAFVERLAVTYTFPVTEAALVGRRGGVAWETLATVPIG